MDPPEVRVGRATADDLDEMLDGFAAVVAEGRWLGTEPGFDRAARRVGWAEQLGRASAATFIARADGAIIGQVGIEIAPIGVAELGMQVHADWRGRGVGRALLTAAVDWARVNGAHKVALEVWPSNRAAIALYQRLGFEEEGRLRSHYRRANGDRWTSLVMGLLLEPPGPDGPSSG